MSSGTELLWPGAALLVLLGVAASLCVRCSRPGAKRSEKIYQQRSLREDQQSFTGSRTYSLVGQAWPGPLADMAPTRKDKLLQFSPSLEGEWHRAGTGLAKLGLRQAKTPCDRCRVVGAAGPDPASSRYQNFSKGSRHGSEKAYIDPIAMEHYNWGRFSKLLEDDDANSYENVLICKQKTRKTGEAAQPEAGWGWKQQASLARCPCTPQCSEAAPTLKPEGSRIPGYLWVEPCPYYPQRRLYWLLAPLWD
ncbi:linker for activation of T-cells family member 2 isoform X3 [Nomascus leucogenys]|uniref:linker for activation of T-cells family member 2 isoform X3 n=1 Tax=Nomascus leucogenys TaxID=61853 RepID=UPI00122D739C|nr:linker for activation of T-cells family member 2 isoform X3 [Nomascus leucogenys]